MTSATVTDPLELTAYYIDRDLPPLAPAPRTRKWLPQFGYRCLPLLIANESGWLVLNKNRMTVRYYGGVEPDAIEIDGEPPLFAESHFGSGILTFRVPYLFRTPPGWNLHVRGPANAPKDGIYPLEGIVETDVDLAASAETFTMNWLVTRPMVEITFEENEPFAMLAPVRRGDVERFQPVYRSLSGEPDIQARLQEWTKSRADYIEEHHGKAPARQGSYIKRAAETKVTLKAPVLAAR